MRRNVIVLIVCAVMFGSVSVLVQSIEQREAPTIAEEQNFLPSLDWIRQGAERHDRTAQYQLGLFYLEGIGFITALTKPQIKTLLDRGALQLELFDENVSEVVLEDGKRYVMRRNPIRAQEMVSRNIGEVVKI